MSPTPPSSGSLADRIAATRVELRRARLQAAQAVESAERLAAERQTTLTRTRAVHDQHLIARGRSGVIGPLLLARHPMQTWRNATEWMVTWLGFPQVDAIVDRARETAAPLRSVPTSDLRTDRPDPDAAIRWLGPVDIAGIVREGLFAHPTSTVEWTVESAPGALVVAHCALAPGAALRSPSGVVFEISAKSGDWIGKVKRLVHPRVRVSDRRWRRLALVLPSSLTGPVVVRLTTRLPAGAAPDFAWAIWGEPRIARRRDVREVVRLGRAVLLRDGVLTTARRMREGGATDTSLDYQRWIAQNTPSAADLEALKKEVGALPLQPVISVITPVYNTDPQWLRACIESVRRQAYPHWELCLADDASTKSATVELLGEYARVDPRIKLVRLPKNGHISAASNAALDIATGDFVALLDHDDDLPPDALAEVVKFVNANREVDFIYSDEDKRDLTGSRKEPYFKPDWSPDHFMNFMYTNHLMVLRRSVVDRVGRFRLGFEGAQDFDLALRTIAVTDRIGHIPKVLYHWRQIPGSAAAEAVAKPWALANAQRALESYVESIKLDAAVETGAAPGLFRVRRKLTRSPRVTIVITTDDRSRTINGREIALLPNVIRSIRQKTQYTNYEILVIDNGNLSQATMDFLSTVPHHRATYTIEGRFNFAHKLNFSVRHAGDDQLVILNDDVEVISPGWLHALLEYSEDPAVGAVGAKLYFPDGRLQHVGVVLGVNGIAAHSFHQGSGQLPGYFGSTLGPRNYSAVTGACLMTRRAVFDEMGGFNEALAIDFNDIDYCLRLRRAGYRVVYTPHAELFHHESGSHGARTWNPAEAEYMRETWADVLARDPYYNQNLTRDFPDYRLRLSTTP